MSSTDKKVNILQFAQWLTQATAKNTGFLLKPGDLNTLYLLFLWEYVSKYHDSGDGSVSVPNITNDTQISIFEKDAVRLVQLYYHNTFYPYFSRLKDL